MQVDTLAGCQETVKRVNVKEREAVATQVLWIPASTAFMMLLSFIVVALKWERRTSELGFITV